MGDGWSLDDMSVLEVIGRAGPLDGLSEIKNQLDKKRERYQQISRAKSKQPRNVSSLKVETVPAERCA